MEIEVNSAVGYIRFPGDFRNLGLVKTFLGKHLNGGLQYLFAFVEVSHNGFQSVGLSV
jgi:hypothetical protein